ncbi:hypothetical protein [Clostridium tagluense]|nr:hypothetical protein [Clostridium tagluense]
MDNYIFLTDEGLWENKAYCESLYKFPLYEHNEIKLMERFKK